MVHLAGRTDLLWFSLANRPIFLCSYVISDTSLIERLCWSMYFPLEPISSGHLASMYGIINALLKEFLILQSPLYQRFDLRAHAAQCEQNFNATIELYDVLAVPSFENIFTLIMKVSKDPLVWESNLITLSYPVYKSTRWGKTTIMLHPHFCSSQSLSNVRIPSWNNISQRPNRKLRKCMLTVLGSIYIWETHLTPLWPCLEYTGLRYRRAISRSFDWSCCSVLGWIVHYGD